MEDHKTYRYRSPYCEAECVSFSSLSLSQMKNILGTLGLWLFIALHTIEREKGCILFCCINHLLKYLNDFYIIHIYKPTYFDIQEIFAVVMKIECIKPNLGFTLMIIMIILSLECQCLEMMKH